MTHDITVQYTLYKEHTQNLWWNRFC